MLNKEEWWSLIAHYDRAIWPWQFLFMGAGVVVTLLFCLKPDKARAALIKVYLAFTNLWIGGGFFLNPQRGFPSPLRQFQGGLFLLIGLLWIYDLAAKRTEFAWPQTTRARLFASLSLGAVLFYPLWGLLLGQDRGQLIYPGSFPCPTAAYSLILIILAKEKKNLLLYLLLLVWAIPLPPAVQIPQYHAYEDLILFLVGVAALFHLIGYRLNNTIRLKTDKDNPGIPAVILIVKAILKGYITRPGFFLAGIVFSLPGFIKKHKAKYPVPFLKHTGLIALIYGRLKPLLGQEKAFEVVRAIVLPVGLSTQQSHMRNVEAERNFKNLIFFQQKTNREGPTRFNTMEIEEQSEDRYQFRVTRCLFREFYTALGMAELTTLMCSVDNLIFNSYLPEKILFHRDGVGKRMIDGHPYCQFIMDHVKEEA
ncbi:MAG: DUF6064 family protein [Spirochaetales bacterium]|nr:DUF6064 family protein [Spirochaetales bacterium]